jgi:hypothetical protein
MALKQSTKQALRNQIPKAALVETRKTVQRAFFSLKTKMIAEFLGHPCY